ncbi:MAG TPA: cohesin domain-containing protein [Candidatus Saccharimonadales bacterium]|nr:cohesin domain-containing protein [Candidatus Saccharimonadales bacterium]
MQSNSKNKLILIILGGLLIILFVITFTLSSKKTTPPVTTQNQVTNGDVKLTLSSAPSQLPDGSYALAAYLDAGKNLITIAQLELTFDPKVLSNVSIQPGPFFTNPNVLLKKVDETKGTVSFIVGIKPGEHGQSGSGKIAILTFHIKQPGVYTTINFSDKSIVSAQGFSKSVLKFSQGVTFQTQ